MGRYVHSYKSDLASNWHTSYKFTMKPVPTQVMLLLPSRRIAANLRTSCCFTRLSDFLSPPCHLLHFDFRHQSSDDMQVHFTACSLSQKLNAIMTQLCMRYIPSRFLWGPPKQTTYIHKVAQWHGKPTSLFFEVLQSASTSFAPLQSSNRLADAVTMWNQWLDSRAAFPQLYT